jgi:uncharacterized protein YjbI with pentapeptide repeats
MADKPDPFDVDALEKSLNDSATRVSTIWISFLIFGLYLVIAAGTVTHRQLLLEDPVKLPVLNIDLPLVGFFFLAPILFVVFHAYVLLQVLLLGRTAAAYNEAVEQSVKVAADNARVRQRLANTLFAQIFAGSPRERDGWLGFLLKVMAWLTLAIAPVLVLLVFQYKFLPYHSHLVTWTHRVLILVELTTVFLLWPLALDSERDIEWRRVVRNPFALASVALFVFISLSLFTFPGEPHVNRFAGQPLDSVQCERWFHVRVSAETPIQWRYWARWQFFDRLDSPLVDVVDGEKLAKIKKAMAERTLRLNRVERTRNFRDRDLNCSQLYEADLRRVDLTRAHIIGAGLNAADLQDASLWDAQLQGAFLDHANLQGASLFEAQLQGASLNYAQLQGASLQDAQLQGASLQGARLQDASLFRAQLQGANLLFAQLQGASLELAQLQGASLEGAGLHGAFLKNAQLQGASLEGAGLYGASLENTQLQGADFKGAWLQGASLDGVLVWRAKNADCEAARVTRHKPDAVIENEKSVPATPEAVAKFIQDSVVGIPDGDLKQQAIDRMRAGLVVDPAEDNTAEIAEVWRKCEEVPQAEFDKKHAAFLRDLVCDVKESRDAIAKGIIRNWISDRKDRSDFSAQLARGLLGEDGKPCAATQDLDERDKERLRAFVPAAASAASPPAVAPPAAAPPK